MKGLVLLFFVIVLCFSIYTVLIDGATTKSKKDDKEKGNNVNNKAVKHTDKKKKALKQDPNEHKGLAAFFLTDPTDGTCLGPNGFVMCDENALWLLTTRAGRQTYSLLSLLTPSQNICLQRKSTFFGLFQTDQLGVGSCRTKSAKSWTWDFLNVDDHVKLTNLGKCLVRGKAGSVHNSISVQDCNKGFTPLRYHVTAVHEQGFLLATANGECFDGDKFRSCYTSDSASISTLYWGIGIRYVWGEAKRYFFNFAPQERNMCLIADSNQKVTRGRCDSSKALTWGLQYGKLSVQNGNRCVSRSAEDSHAAVLSNCQQGYEYMLMNVPVTGVSDNVLKLLKSPNLSKEEKSIIADIVQQRTNPVQYHY